MHVYCCFRAIRFRQDQSFEEYFEATRSMVIFRHVFNVLLMPIPQRPKWLCLKLIYALSQIFTADYFSFARIRIGFTLWTGGGKKARSWIVADGKETICPLDCWAKNES